MTIKNQNAKTNTEKEGNQKGVKTMFYRAYCKDDDKTFGNWNSDKTIAKNYKARHLESYPLHDVKIERS